MSVKKVIAVGLAFVWTIALAATYSDSFPSDTATSEGWGANWLHFRDGSEGTSLQQVTSGRGVITSSFSNRVAVWNGGAVTDDQFSEAFVYGAADNGGLVVRASTVDGNTLYWGGPDSGVGGISIRKVVAGTSSVLSNTSHTHVDGDKYRLSVQGNVLNLYINDVLVLGPITDSSSPIASGQPGVIGINTIEVDDWSGGDIEEGGDESSIPAIYRHLRQMKQ